MSPPGSATPARISPRRSGGPLSRNSPNAAPPEASSLSAATAVSSWRTIRRRCSPRAVRAASRRLRHDGLPSQMTGSPAEELPLKDEIFQRMDELTPAERKVARTLLARYPAAGLESTAALAA